MKPHADGKKMFSGVIPILQKDNDPQETAEWMESLDFVCQSRAAASPVFAGKTPRTGLPHRRALRLHATTPYINTIPVELQPEYPGDREIERRIKSIIRWNAMAMVVRANKLSSGIGGHISTFASAATLYEVAFNHFFRGKQARSRPTRSFSRGTPRRESTPGPFSWAA